MPEQETPSTEETPSSESVETPPAGNGPEGEQSTEEKPGEEPAEETVPADVLRKELTSANAEAANYRTKLRETEAKLSQAKTLEEFEAATSELRGQVEALERTILLNDVARKYELPEALAKRLTGTTAEELEADAKELQKLVAPQSAPESLAGGLTPEDGEDDFDPVKAARAARRRRY